jgi:hypothetical protein
MTRSMSLSNLGRNTTLLELSIALDDESVHGDVNV